mgnify:CR=1 FL=1
MYGKGSCNMQKKRFLSLLLTLLLVCVFALTPRLGIADAGDFSGGISQAVDDIISVAEGNPAELEL